MRQRQLTKKKESHNSGPVEIPLNFMIIVVVYCYVPTIEKLSIVNPFSFINVLHTSFGDFGSHSPYSL